MSKNDKTIGALRFKVEALQATCEQQREQLKQQTIWREEADAENLKMRKVLFALLEARRQDGIGMNEVERLARVVLGKEEDDWRNS